jgi:hypothetical protein
LIQLTLHAGLGATTAAITGNDILSGALAGAASEYVAQTVYENGVSANNAIISGQVTGAATSLLASSIQGNSDEQVAKDIQLGGMIGANAAANNAVDPFGIEASAGDEKKFAEAKRKLDEYASSTSKDLQKMDDLTVEIKSLKTDLQTDFANSVIDPNNNIFEKGISYGGLLGTTIMMPESSWEVLLMGTSGIGGGLMSLEGRAVTSLSNGIANPIPETFARVIGGSEKPVMLGLPNRSDVFVTDSKVLQGLTPTQISKTLSIESNNTFTVIEFPSSGINGIASPINRNYELFIGGGRTAGGAPEFVIPNAKIPDNSTIKIIK